MKSSFINKMFLTLALFQCIGLLAGALFVLSSIKREFRVNFAKEKQVIAELLAHSLQQDLCSEHFDLSHKAINEHFRAGAFDYAVVRLGSAIIDSAGTISHMPGAPDTNQTAAVMEKNKIYVTYASAPQCLVSAKNYELELGFDFNYTETTIGSILKVKIAITTFLIFIASVIAFVASRRLNVRVNQIQTVCEAIGNNDFTKTIDESRKDEFAKIGRSINKMSAALKQLQMETENNRKERVVAAKLTSLGEMAAGIAHEINSPLAIVKLNTEICLEEVEAGTADKNFLTNKLKTILATTERIARIVRGLKHFSRDTEKDDFVEFDFNEVLEDCLALCSEKFKNHGVTLEIQLDQNFKLFGRSTQIAQVLVNLMNNSFDEIKNLPKPWIRLDKVETAESITIRVTDSGSGIPPAIVEKIMQPFFTTKEIGKGTGLGLSISKGIIESHNGKLFVDQTCSNTRFCITLPKPGHQSKAA